MAGAGSGSFFDQNVSDIALRSLFEKYDSDQNGFLDEKELFALLRNDLGLTIDQAQAYYLLLDKDGDNRISFNEFRTWVRSKEDFKSVTCTTRFYYIQKAICLFQQYDEDGNNSLDFDEFKAMLGGESENVEQIMAKLDVDKNGRISFQEFLKWLNWIPVDDIFTPENST